MILILATFSGCTTTAPKPVIPALAVDPGEVYQPGRFVWYDMFSGDALKTASFYEDLFGWELKTSPDFGNYSFLTLAGQPVAGMIQLEGKEAKQIAPQWVPNLLVNDLEQAVERFKVGGSVRRGPVDVPDRGRVAVVEGNEGAPLILLQTSNGVPPPPKGTAGTFLWTELWSSDEAKSLSFYGNAVGYRRLDSPVPGRSEDSMLGTGDKPQAGLVQIPSDQVKPHWLSYVAVSDPMQTAARAVALGGRVLIAPGETIDGSAAVLADPSGAVFGIQKWPLESAKEVQP